jgi:uncharacterized protein (TIRG00374 family)
MERTRVSDQDDARRRLELEEPDEADGRDPSLDTEQIEAGPLARMRDPRRIAAVLGLFLLAIVAIYVLIPAVVGLDEALHRFDQAVWYWLIVALGFTVAGFAAYGALFRGVLAGADEDLRRRLDLKASYEITIAGFAASRVFSAGGAGGVALTYWALRRAGMARRRAACRMVAFLALLYSIYLLALLLFGILLRTGVLPGENPLGGTIIPAAVAGVALLLVGLIALIPGDVERRLRRLSTGKRQRRRISHLAARLATGPAIVATGIRTAIDFIRYPRRGALGLAGALGFWAANIGTLWASFEAFGGNVPVAVLVQGFFVGMVANLLPSPAGGLGTIDAGMIGAFLLFGVPGGLVFPAVLIYRVMAFWLPIPPGIVAYVQLRRTVAGWAQEGQLRGRYTIKSEVTAEAT